MKRDWQVKLWPLVLATIACCFCCGCRAEKPLSFTVTFKEGGGLQEGHYLVYNGIRIGEVKDMRLDPAGTIKVEVKLDQEYRTLAYREAEFIVEKPSANADKIGEHQLTMYDRSGPRTPLVGGEIIAGTEGSIDHWFNKVKDAGQHLWDVVKGSTSEQLSQPSISDSGSDVNDFVQSCKEFADSARTLANDQYDSFAKSTLPELEQRAKDLRDKLESTGKKEEARKFWDNFSTWLKHLSERAL